MLKGQFYDIVELNIQSASTDVVIRLNEKHAIFQGHFPGQPIVPGACFMQIIKEITGIVVNSKLQVVKAEELKFLMPVCPSGDNMLMMNIVFVIHTDGQIHLIVNFRQNNAVCCKCKVTCIRR